MRFVSGFVCELYFYFSYVKFDMTIRLLSQMPDKRLDICSEEQMVLTIE